MPDVPTFNTTTGEQCPLCLSQSKTGWGVQSLLLLIGLSVLGGVGYLLTQLTTHQNAALPPTAPVSRSSFASPFPTTVDPSPTANPLIPPTYAIVVPVTFTPVPTATMTSFQAQSTAVMMTAEAGKVPKACPETTVVPGTPVICYWPVKTPTPIPTPTYKPCATPLPGAFCKKGG